MERGGSEAAGCWGSEPGGAGAADAAAIAWAATAAAGGGSDDAGGSSGGGEAGAEPFGALTTTRRATTSALAAAAALDGANASSGGGGGGGGGGVSPPAGVLHTYQAYEERPAVARAMYGGGGDGSAGSLDDDALAAADPSTVSAAALFGAAGVAGAAVAARASAGVVGSGSSGVGGGASGGAVPVCAAPAPTGWPADLPAPEPLSPAAAGEAAPVLDVAGEYVAAALLSRAWQLRDAASAWLAQLAAGGGLTGPERREAARGLLRLAVKGLRDKVPQVYISSLGLLQVRHSSSSSRAWCAFLQQL